MQECLELGLASLSGLSCFVIHAHLFFPSFPTDTLFIFPWHEIRIYVSTNQTFQERLTLSFPSPNSHAVNQCSYILPDVFTPRPIQEVEVLGKTLLTRFRTRTHLSFMTCCHNVGSCNFVRELLQ